MSDVKAFQEGTVNPWIAALHDAKPIKPEAHLPGVDSCVIIP
jgi:hypothetical protein